MELVRFQKAKVVTILATTAKVRAKCIARIVMALKKLLARDATAVAKSKLQFFTA